MTNDSHETGPSAPGRPAVEAEVSLWEVMAVILRGRWVIVATTVVVAALAVATGFLSDNYTTYATFRPQGSEAQASQLASLASQFGFNLGSLANDEASPDFYAELLLSRAILSPAARANYEPAELGRVGLVELLEIEEETPELELREVLEWLEDDAVTTRVSNETGTVTLTVASEWPEVSFDIAGILLAEMIDFNLNTRQSRAGEERRFIEVRVDSARAALLEAETAMQRFYEANRLWDQSPELQFQQGRLAREVTLRQGVLSTLSQSFVQAEIAEVRDTPVITVLSEPFLPPGPDPRYSFVRAAIGLVLGVTLGTVLSFLREAVKRPSGDDPFRDDFFSTWDGFLRSIPIFGRSRG